jgi:AAHS family 4-hydroxybenzoate transporter-like MFS transporter
MPFVLREAPTYLLSKGRQADAELGAARLLGSPVRLATEDVMPGRAGAGTATILGSVNRRLSLGSGVAFFAASIISYAFAAWTTVLLTSVGFTLPQALKASFAFNLAAVGIALAAGYLVRLLGSRWMLQMSGGGLLVTIGALAFLIGSLPAIPSPTEQLAVNLLIGCIGGLAGAAMASIYAVMAFGYAPSCRASGIGFGMMLGRAGGILTSLLGGYLIGENGSASPNALFVVLGLNAVIIIAAALMIDRHIPGRHRCVRPIIPNDNLAN